MLKVATRELTGGVTSLRSLIVTSQRGSNESAEADFHPWACTYMFVSTEKASRVLRYELLSDGDPSGSNRLNIAEVPIIFGYYIIIIIS